MKTTLLVCLLAAVELGAQTPVIKMTTRQVQVNVVVRDKKGQAVAGLTKDDFVLLDNGQPQEIRYFAAEVAKPGEAAPDPVPALPPGMFSNRALPSTLTVVLLDGLNARYDDRARARDGLMKFFSSLRAGDRVAVYTLTNELRVMHNFTTDTAALIQELNQGSAINHFLTESINPMVTNMPQLRTPMTMSALRMIAFHLAGIPGRKNLIWLSDGFPLTVGLRANGRVGRNYESFEDEIRSAERALEDAGVAIYPVDARGMIGGFDYSPSTAPGTPAPRSRRQAANMDAQAQFDINQSQGNLKEIAESTGGLAFTNSNDLGSAIRRAVDDTSLTYTLGFAPNHDHWDGKFHEIRIKVTHPDAKARYRQGYYATEDKPETREARTASLLAGAESALPPTALSLLGRVVDAPAGQVSVRVTLNTREVGFTQGDDGKWGGEVDVLMVLRDPAGKVAGQKGQTYRFRLTQAQFDEAAQNGLALDAAAPTATAPSQARVVVRDIASGNMGSLEMPIK